MSRKASFRLALIGIGNTLAGDDGAGIRVVEMLKSRLSGSRAPDVFFAVLEGDLLAVTDMLDTAYHFIFVDAVAGSPPGSLVVSQSIFRAFAPSFHQTDMGTLMMKLRKLQLCDPFPSWEIRGITIEPPTELKEGLSPDVERAVQLLADTLEMEILHP